MTTQRTRTPVIRPARRPSFSCYRSRLVLQFSYPDVAVTDRIAVVLEFERQLVGVGLVGRPRLIGRWADQLEIVLDQHAVEQHRHPRRTLERAVGFEMRAVEDDVVGLPLARPARWIYERRILTVHGAGLTVGIGVVLIGIEDLQLVNPHQEDAPGPPLLPAPADDGGSGPLERELHVAEPARRLNHAGPRLHFHVAVRERPLRRARIFRAPLRKVLGDYTTHTGARAGGTGGA